jgi:hypothetical protein
LLRGLCSRRYIRPSKRMSILTAAFRSSHVIGAGTSVVLTRWIRRVAFVGTAAHARPCGHAFFMLRFLARSSAGTDGSFIGRAGRGLVLSRRNERRAEERRDDKSRDCKFGSHQNVSVGYRITPNLGLAIQFRRVANIAQISFSKKLFGDRSANIRHFPDIRHLPDIGFAQSGSIGCAPRLATNVEQDLIGGYAMFVDRIKSPRCPKCGAMMALRIIEPERPGFDSRTFECPKCFDTETLVASISCEIDASIGLA